MNISLQNQWLFVSDVDDTLLGDEKALIELTDVLQAVRHSITIVYNSSRPCASLRQTLATLPHMPRPDYLIGAMGTEIQEVESQKILTEYVQHFVTGWEYDQIIELVDKMGFKAHPKKYQTPFKRSYDIPNEKAYAQVLQELKAAKLPAKVIYSGGKNLDIIPLNGGKGNAIKYLLQYLDILPQYVAVAGDSENDLEMFVMPYRCIIVANAAPELKKLAGTHIYHAKSPYASGILEGLRYWQILS